MASAPEEVLPRLGAPRDPSGLLSGIWDDGTTAAQLPVNVAKTSEIPVFRQLLKKIPDAEITADQMHNQREQERALRVHDRGEPALTVRRRRRAVLGISGRGGLDRGHVDVRVIKTMPATERKLGRDLNAIITALRTAIPPHHAGKPPNDQHEHEPAT